MADIKELLEQHEKDREKIMTREQMQDADTLVEYFKCSWHDKSNRGLFEKWQLSDLYWEGDVNLPEYEDDPGSNTNVVNANVEGQTILAGETNPSVTVDPQEPSDVPFTEHAKTIAEFIMKHNNMPYLIRQMARRRKKFGDGIISVFWNAEKLEPMGLPELKCWNPAYVFCDPYITDIADKNNSRFFIFVASKSISWAADMFGAEKAAVIIPKYHPAEQDWIYGEDPDESGSPIAGDNYMHMYVLTKTDGKVRIRQMSSCGVLLWDSMEENVILPEKEYPVFFAPDMEREGTIHAKGSVELLLPLQDTINDLDDQIRINARLTGNIQKVIGTGSQIDPEKWTNQPGLNITAADPNDWKMVVPPNMPPYIQEKRNATMYTDRQIVTRFSDQMSGIRQRGVDTATESLALQQSGLAGVDSDKNIIQQCLAEAITYALELAKENWTEEYAFRVSNKRNSFMWYRASDLKKIPRLIPASREFRNKFRDKHPDIPLPEYMQAKDKDEFDNEIDATKDAKFDITVSIGSGMPSNKAFRYNAVKETFSLGAMDVEEYRQRIRELGILPENSYEQEKKRVKKLEQLRTTRAARSPNVAPNADVEGMTADDRPSLATMREELNANANLQQ